MKTLLISILAIFSTSSLAKEVNLLVGMTLPPYIIEKPLSGIEYEIALKALEQQGYQLKLKFVPLKRVPLEFVKDSYDGAMTLNDNFEIKSHMSNSYISYQNFAITLKSKNLSINTIKDLKQFSVASFQNAQIYLGADFKEATQNKKYKEFANQAQQNKMLFKKRIDVVVGDKNIFKYFLKKLDKKAFNTNQGIVFHNIFPQNDYKIAFKSKELCDDFNKGLEKIKKAGLIKQIINKYI